MPSSAAPALQPFAIIKPRRPSNGAINASAIFIFSGAKKQRENEKREKKKDEKTKGKKRSNRQTWARASKQCDWRGVGGPGWLSLQRGAIVISRPSGQFTDGSSGRAGRAGRGQGAGAVDNGSERSFSILPVGCSSVGPLRLMLDDGGRWIGGRGRTDGEGPWRCRGLGRNRPPPPPHRRILILSGRYYSGVIAFAALTAAATANGSEASVKHSAPLTLCAGSEGVEPCDCLPPSRAAPL
jgi:hypothetical protein